MSNSSCNSMMSSTISKESPTNSVSSVTCSRAMPNASAHRTTVRVAREVPTARLMAQAALGPYERVAHLLVPQFPHRPFVVMEHLRGIIVVIHVFGRRSPGAERFDAALERRLVALPAQV